MGKGLGVGLGLGVGVGSPLLRREGLEPYRARARAAPRARARAQQEVADERVRRHHGG